MTSVWWTSADAAELDVLLHELARGFVEHRERCDACSPEPCLILVDFELVFVHGMEADGDTDWQALLPPFQTIVKYESRRAEPTSA